MTQTIPKPITQPITFDQFVDWYPEDAASKYELHNGAIVEMPLGTGQHSNITGFIAGEFHFEIRRLKLDCSIPGDCLLKFSEDESGYRPDIVVLDRDRLQNEPRWQKESVITAGSSVRLVVEVVSTNWQNDYSRKSGDYEVMGIPEYWIVDYLGLGGRRFIGEEKLPAVSVYQMIDGEYDVKQFRGDQRIESLAFPDLQLTAAQIFQAST